MDERATLLALARADARRYARHPLFLVPCAVIVVAAAGNVVTKNVGGTNPLLPTMSIAFLLGVFGFVVAHRLTTSLRRTNELAGTVPAGEQLRTLSLCLACLVPAATGLVAAGYVIVQNVIWPPESIPPGAPVTWFGDYPAIDVLATLLAMGPVAALGGPLLGVAVARWAPFRGSALLGVVVLVVATAIPASDATGDEQRLISAWPILMDEHVVDEKVVSSTFVPRARADLGTRLGAVPVRAGRRGGPPSGPESSAPGAGRRRRPDGRRGGVLRAGTVLTSAARAPWPVAMTALVTSALVLLVAAFQQTAGALPFVTLVAQLALAGGAAYLLDDAAAPLTTVAPRGPWRRRGPVLVVGVGLLAGAWLGVLALLQWRDVRPPVAESSAELLVMGLVGLATAALLFRLGDHEPGVIVAPMVVVLGLGLAIVGSLAGSPIYLTDAEPTPGLIAGWSAAGALAALMIVVAGRDVAEGGMVRVR